MSYRSPRRPSRSSRRSPISRFSREVNFAGIPIPGSHSGSEASEERAPEPSQRRAASQSLTRPGSRIHGRAVPTQARSYDLVCKVCNQTLESLLAVKCCHCGLGYHRGCQAQFVIGYYYETTMCRNCAERLNELREEIREYFAQAHQIWNEEAFVSCTHKIPSERKQEGSIHFWSSE